MKKMNQTDQQRLMSLMSDGIREKLHDMYGHDIVVLTSEEIGLRQNVFAVVNKSTKWTAMVEVDIFVPGRPEKLGELRPYEQDNATKAAKQDGPTENLRGYLVDLIGSVAAQIVDEAQKARMDRDMESRR